MKRMRRGERLLVAETEIKKMTTIRLKPVSKQARKISRRSSIMHHWGMNHHDEENKKQTCMHARTHIRKHTGDRLVLFLP